MDDNIYKEEGTQDTPLFLADKNTGQLIVKGVCMPENAYEFFDPLEKKVQELFAEYVGEMKLEIELSYLNSMSTKQLLKLIKHLAAKHDTLKVIWKYAPEDDLIRIKGEEIRSVCSSIEFTVEQAT